MGFFVVADFVFSFLNLVRQLVTLLLYRLVKKNFLTCLLVLLFRDAHVVVLFFRFAQAENVSLDVLTNKSARMRSNVGDGREIVCVVFECQNSLTGRTIFEQLNLTELLARGVWREFGNSDG